MGQTCSGPNKTSPTLTVDTLEHLDILLKQESFKSGKKVIHGSISSSTTVSTQSILPVKLNESMYYVNPDNYPVSNLISPTIFQGQDMSKSDQNIRTTFVSYIRSFLWLESLTFDIHEQLVSRRRPTLDTQEIAFNEYSVKSRSSTESRGMESVANTMMRCTQLKIRDTIKSSPKRKGSVETCFPAEQMRNVLLMTLWPLFVETDGYKSAVDNGQPYLFHAKEGKDVFNHISPGTSAINAEKIKHAKEIYIQAAEKLANDELERVLSEGIWATKLLGYLDCLPLSVSVASVSADKPFFPIVFVNKTYERTTLYPRSEVLGRNDEFLVGDNTERDQLAKIAEAINKAEGAKIAITHVRKNGTEFLDFLALRPVIARKTQEYKYVIAVQYDISRAEASLKEIRMVADFLTIMGNLLKG